ncbi:hypothetical protein FRC10_001077 [Ceratobasidium sp. 414]|nr:hypothetical protein FRC10_001077 [Ceratobasidium sp. 414]
MSSSTRTTAPSPISISATKFDHGSKGRARSSSIVAVQEVGGGGAEEVLDQSVYRNQNSGWISYIMFHGITGIPFDPDLHGGAYDDLTLWEQIDEGAQYTPAKKWLFTMPIGLPALRSIPEAPTTPLTVQQLHRQRIRFLVDEPTPSGAVTPMTPMTPIVSGTNTPVNRRSWAQAPN